MDRIQRTVWFTPGSQTAASQPCPMTSCFCNHGECQKQFVTWNEEVVLAGAGRSCTRGHQVGGGCSTYAHWYFMHLIMVTLSTSLKGSEHSAYIISKLQQPCESGQFYAHVAGWRGGADWGYSGLSREHLLSLRWHLLWELLGFHSSPLQSTWMEKALEAVQDCASWIVMSEDCPSFCSERIWFL